MPDSGTPPTLVSRILTVVPFVLCAVLVVVFLDCHVRGDRLGFGVEDGPLEWGTVFFFAMCAALCITARVANRATLPRREGILIVAFAVVLLVGIGEELSWGQRIFDWDPPEIVSRGRGALIEAGHDDTTLHNLSFRSEHLKFSIGGLLFGVPMLIAVGLHGIWLPIAYRKGDPPARWLVEKLGVFIPPIRLGALACGTGTIIYVCRKVLDTDVEANEFIEITVPMVYAFILLSCYFAGGRRLDRVVTGVFAVLLLAWLALTVGMVVTRAPAATPAEPQAHALAETAGPSGRTATIDPESRG